MTKNARKARDMFLKGALAAKKYTNSDQYYICPICTTMFTEEALSNEQLSLEHVPPKSLGGKGILLTCKTCNNTAGDTIDAAMSNRANLDRFTGLMMGGQEDKLWRASLEINGQKINIDITRSESGRIDMEAPISINNPCVIDELLQNAEKLGSDSSKSDQRFSITPRIRYKKRWAKIGDLKTAFLAAFAIFGYGYALAPALRPVREQILKPDRHVIDNWSIRPHNGAIADYLLLVEQPLSCIVVTCNRISVILPTPNSTSSFYEDVAIVYGQGHMQVNGTPFPWPTGLELVLDT